MLQSARMVGDEEDYAVWQRGCETWRAAVALTLDEHFCDSAITLAQRRAVSPPGASWKREYEAELQDVAATLQLLTRLSEELRNDVALRGVGPTLALAR